MKIKPEAFEDCLAKIAARGKINSDEAKQLLQEVASRAEQMRNSGQPDPFVTAAGELAARVTDGAKKAKADALRNAKVRADAMTSITNAGGIRNAVETLRAMMHGTYRASLDSVQSMSRGLASSWQGVLSWKLRSLGIEKAAVSGLMDRDNAIELGKLNGWSTKGSGNIQAEAWAKAVQPILGQIRDRLNALGADIGSPIDYVTKTRHDPIKMRRAAGSFKDPPAQAFAAWWADTLPKLSEKTFAGVVPLGDETMTAARNRFGKSVFDALVTGVHMTVDGARADDYVPAGFEGSHNIARKVSQPRTLFWKDAESWHDYVQKYGDQTSLTDGIMRSISQGSRQIGLMSKFGSNPGANLEQIMRSVEESGRHSGDTDAVTAFGNKKGALRNVMAYLDGSANVPLNSDWSKIGQNLRTLYAVWDLGGVGVTHFASIWPTVSSELRHHGINRLETLSGMASQLVKGKGSAEAQEILSDLGAYADGLSRDMSANFQSDTPIPGRLSGMANTFMKYTGIHYVFDNTQAAVRSMLSHNLARNMSKGFGDLDPHLQGMLSAYGIQEKDWDLLRAATDLRSENGRAYLTPRDAQQVDPSGVLADKLMGYYSDTAAHSTVTAGARERAMLLGGTRPGSGWGEGVRFLTQFKMWPVAAYDQLLRREIYMSTLTKDAAWGIGSMVALSTAAGYMRMAISDLALGNPVRDPRDWKTLLAGAAQGGGLGIMGDFLFGEALRNRFGAGVVGTLGGPLVSDADSLFHIYNQWMQGKADWTELARFATRHVPFANLVYIKGALDYLMFYHLYEAASPGWWERSNRKMQKEQGRTMTGYSPGAGVPTGVPFAYMRTPSGTTSGIFSGSGR